MHCGLRCDDMSQESLMHCNSQCAKTLQGSFICCILRRDDMLQESLRIALDGDDVDVNKVKVSQKALISRCKVIMNGAHFTLQGELQGAWGWKRRN